MVNRTRSGDICLNLRRVRVERTHSLRAYTHGKTLASRLWGQVFSLQMKQQACESRSSLVAAKASEQFSRFCQVTWRERQLLRACAPALKLVSCFPRPRRSTLHFETRAKPSCARCRFYSRRDVNTNSSHCHTTDQSIPATVTGHPTALACPTRRYHKRLSA